MKVSDKTMKAYLCRQLFWTYLLLIQSSLLKGRECICRHHLRPLPNAKIWFHGKYKRRNKRKGIHTTIENMPTIHERIT